MNSMGVLLIFELLDRDGASDHVMQTASLPVEKTKKKIH